MLPPPRNVNVEGRQDYVARGLLVQRSREVHSSAVACVEVGQRNFISGVYTKESEPRIKVDGDYGSIHFQPQWVYDHLQGLIPARAAERGCARIERDRQLADDLVPHSADQVGGLDLLAVQGVLGPYLDCVVPQREKVSVRHSEGRHVSRGFVVVEEQYAKALVPDNVEGFDTSYVLSSEVYRSVSKESDVPAPVKTPSFRLTS